MKNATSSKMVYITLNHDIRQQTAYNLTDFMLNYLVTNDFSKSVTVGDCLGDPSENWYRKTPTGPDSALEVTVSASSAGTQASSTSVKSSSPAGSSVSTTPKSDSSGLRSEIDLRGPLVLFLGLLGFFL